MPVLLSILCMKFSQAARTLELYPFEHVSDMMRPRLSHSFSQPTAFAALHQHAQETLNNVP